MFDGENVYSFMTETKEGQKLFQIMPFIRKKINLEKSSGVFRNADS